MTNYGNCMHNKLFLAKIFIDKNLIIFCRFYLPLYIKKLQRKEKVKIYIN